ncbi:MAG: lysophospholipid acyltransferase family protein [Planctomycetota bacterium]
MNLQSWRRIPIPKTIIFLAEYFILRWFIFLLTALPYDITTSLVRNFVRFGYSLAGKYRNITVENIRLAKPQVVKTPEEANRLALRTFEYFALSFVHMLYMDRFIYLKEKKHISFENTEVIDRALKENRGLILISGHLGNWEIGINELAKKGYPINLVAFQYVNPYLNNMMNRFRLDCGVTIIPTKGAISKCEETLKKEEVVIMLIDQTGREEGVEVQFFGRTAPAMWGPANLHIKTGAPIIPYGVTFTAESPSSQRIRYTIKIGDKIIYQPTGSKDNDIKELTQIYLNEIEKIIRRAPEQWIWFHRRWKKYK